MMLRIHRCQFNSFDEAQQSESARRIRDHLKASFQELARRHPERLEVAAIRRSFARARSYALDDDEQVGKFTLLAFILGEDFDLEPRSHFVLTEPLWHPTARVDHIIGWIEAHTQRLTTTHR